MKRAITTRRTNPPGTAGLSRVLPQIRALIEASRQHVVSTANLTLVWLYWNVGRVITEDIQQNKKRADYGEHLLAALADKLTGLYGRGFSRPNLQDMRRFFETFEIRQPLASNSAPAQILQTLSREFADSEILPSLAAETSPDQICQPLASKSASPQIFQPAVGESSARQIQQTAAAESKHRLTIDFAKHAHLGWTLG